MTVAFVHGNPETAALWSPLVERLGASGVSDVVRLSPPGFGAPLPDDFTATAGAYRKWLIRELEAIGKPVDLVGHDWGGGHVLGVAITRPDLLTTWVSDVVGTLAPDYAWHDLAQAWQTEGIGEEALAHQFRGTTADRAGRMRSLGIPEPVANEFAAAQGPEMARAVLALYRSAAQPAMAELGRHLEAAAARPGLSVLATADTFVGTAEQRRTTADRAGAATIELEGLGHWWMLEDPAAAAAALCEFWATTGSKS